MAGKAVELMGGAWIDVGDIPVVTNGVAAKEVVGAAAWAEKEVGVDVAGSAVNDAVLVAFVTAANRVDVAVIGGAFSLSSSFTTTG